MRFTVFKTSKLQFVLHILAFTKFLLRWWAPWKLWWTLFKSSFPTLDTLCRLDLQCFQTFGNCCLFCAFWLIRNIYSGDAHDANYCKHRLNHHFQYWTQCISDLQRFEIFRNSTLFSTFWLLRNFYSCDAHHANYGKHTLNNQLPTMCTQCIWDLQCFEIFRNSSFLSTFWLLRNFYGGDAHHSNHGKHTLNNHFRHCSHCVYEIYSVFKLFKMAVSFSPLGFYKISSMVTRIMLTMANIV